MQTSRVLSRMGARELTAEEVSSVSGATRTVQAFRTVIGGHADILLVED